MLAGRLWAFVGFRQVLCVCVCVGKRPCTRHAAHLYVGAAGSARRGAGMWEGPGASTTVCSVRAVPQVYSTTRVCVLQHWVLSGHLWRGVCATCVWLRQRRCGLRSVWLWSLAALRRHARCLSATTVIVILMTGQAGRPSPWCCLLTQPWLGSLCTTAHVASLHTKQHSLTLCMGAASSFHFE